MKLMIDIPKEFEEHFNKDKFSDSLARVASDIENFGVPLSGRYEKETITMLRKAFEDATPLEAQPNRCDSCTHSEERDGSNCYECIKGMADNFEAQPKTSYISINVTKFAKKVAEKALDEITYEGKTVREWVEIIVKQQPCEAVSREQALLALTGMDLPTDRDKLIALFTERIQHLPPVTPRTNLAETSRDCISRQAVLDNAYAYGNGLEPEGYCVNVEDIQALPPVTPTNEDIKEAYIKGYDYGVKDWFKSKTQPCEDCISREEVRRILGNEVFELTKLHTVNPEDNPKADAMAYGVNWSLNTLMELPSVTPERPKGKWIHWTDDYKDYCTCSECGYGEEGEVLLKDKTPYCPYCGSCNGGGEDENNPGC